MRLGEGMRGLGQPCWTHAQCRRNESNSYCEGLVCVCASGFHAMEGRCSRNLWEDIGLSQAECLVIAAIVSLAGFAFIVVIVYMVVAHFASRRKLSPEVQVVEIDYGGPFDHPPLNRYKDPKYSNGKSKGFKASTVSSKSTTPFTEVVNLAKSKQAAEMGRKSRRYASGARPLKLDIAKMKHTSTTPEVVKETDKDFLFDIEYDIDNEYIYCNEKTSRRVRFYQPEERSTCIGMAYLPKANSGVRRSSKSPSRGRGAQERTQQKQHPTATPPAARHAWYQSELRNNRRDAGSSSPDGTSTKPLLLTRGDSEDSSQG